MPLTASLPQTLPPLAPFSGRNPAPILLVEDDVDIRALLTECLEDSGFGVVEAVDAEDAIGLLECGLSPSLVITDINLGAGETGLAVADEVRQILPGTPVVFITGRIDMLRDRGLRDGEFVVPKPFPLSALLGVVRRFVATSPGLVN